MSEEEHLTPETEIALIKQRLNSGAATFGWIRAAVLTALLSSVGAAAGMIYQIGRTSVQREVMADQIADLKIRVGKTEVALEGMSLRATTLETLVRAEQDRREAQEALLRSVAGRRWR